MRFNMNTHNFVRKWIYNVKIRLVNPEDGTEADALLGKYLEDFAVFENYQPCDLMADGNEDKLERVNAILNFWERQKPLITFTIALNQSKNTKRKKNFLPIKRFLYLVEEDIKFWDTSKDPSINPN